MNISTLISNFSDNKRINHSDQELSVISQGNVYYDMIFVLLFVLLSTLSIRPDIINNTYPSKTSLIIPLTFIIILLYKSRGDNKLTIKLSEKLLVVKKRSLFLFFIPKKTIRFDEINSFEIIQRTSYSGIRSIKSYAIITNTKTGLSKQTTLISFLEDEENNAAQLLSFLKSVTAGQM